MYAIVEVQGKQYKVEKGSKISVSSLGEGDDVAAPEIKVLLVKKDDGSVLVGTPYVDGASVTSKVLEAAKGEKIVVYKYKKRKDYDRKRGYRDKLHNLEIEEIKA